MKNFTKILTAALVLSSIIFFGCKKDSDSPSNNGGGSNVIVIVNTYDPYDITPTSAKCGAEVTIPSGTYVDEIGVCWSTSENPTPGDDYLSTDVYDEPFECTITGLSASTEYHVRAFAIRNSEFFYGDEKLFLTTYGEVASWSPEPDAGGIIPQSVLPNSYYDEVTAHFTVYSGENPVTIDIGQFVSSPHIMMYSNIADDTVSLYNDRYFAILQNGGQFDFYGKQWDDITQEYYNEAYRRLYVIGTGDSFTFYYLTAGYPNGLYAKQATIFSGRWNESYGGVKDFQTAVILLESSGNPNLVPAGSIRILGDGDGLARDTTWISGKSGLDKISVSAEDAFELFRK